MANQFLKLTITICALAIGADISTVTAGALQNRGGEQSSESAQKFDGVWVGRGNVTLVKGLKGYVILQGKDPTSTWSAKGIIHGNTLICRGTGEQNDGATLVYESTMTLEGGHKGFVARNIP